MSVEPERYRECKICLHSFATLHTGAPLWTFRDHLQCSLVKRRVDTTDHLRVGYIAMLIDNKFYHNSPLGTILFCLIGILYIGTHPLHQCSIGCLLYTSPS